MGWSGRLLPPATKLARGAKDRSTPVSESVRRLQAIAEFSEHEADEARRKNASAFRLRFSTLRAFAAIEPCNGALDGRPYNVVSADI